MLGSLGVTSASTLLWALGCGAPAGTRLVAPQQASGEVRSWLRDAVARLSAVYPSAHALAVTRKRTTGAMDVLGSGVARARHDGMVLTIRDRDGVWREHATADLSEGGVRAAVQALVGTRTLPSPARIAFPAAPPPPRSPDRIGDTELHNRLGAIHRNDRSSSSRIIYSAALIDVDDVNVWSIAAGHDQEQHVRRVRQLATRAAWSGTRPIVSEVERGWTGAIEDHHLDEEAVTSASRHALQLMTPGAFADGEHTVVLEPEVTAAIVDAAVRGLLTTSALRRPEVARRSVIGASIAGQPLTLVDDPRSPGAYGGSAFDDEGELAVPITLLDQGRVSGRLADRAGVAAKLASVAGRGRRAGHVGAVEPGPTHLQLSPGTATVKDLSTEGWQLEGTTTAVFDPASDRIVIGVARARELRNGNDTGRVFGDVELVGDLASLLANISGIGAETATVVSRDERDGEPRWRSISAPWIRTRGMVRARRRLT
ncbi:MAG: peptidase modulator of gyrase [Myxococcales bacterium]|nr:peptidase modulator of gyrase [Myxococcales bacterium]